MDHTLVVGIMILLQVAVIVRVLLIGDRDPSSRAAWLLAVLLLPGLGVAIYILLGEPWFTPRSRQRSRSDAIAAEDRAIRLIASVRSKLEDLPDRFRASFNYCETLSRMPPVSGNRAELAGDSNDAIDRLVADMDAATSTIHVSFYIWLPDRNGTKVAAAMERAAKRGVVCRAIVDEVGSRLLIQSESWPAMAAGGVRLCKSMPLRAGWGIRRADLRNHRKIAVIDNRLTYCGSQNCADPEFAIKPHYAPWVDIMLRIEGPLAVQNQVLFATDWQTETGEDLTSIFDDPVPPTHTPGFDGLALGTGPLSAKGSMSQVFVGLLNAALSEAVITTPYFVPDAPLLAALLACARRGIRTVLILPARNDSWLIGLISRAYYPQLLEAGVEIHEFVPGLLHSKTLVIDRSLTLIGSANMDRRSLELNFENNILLHDRAVSEAIRSRQDTYLAAAKAVTRAKSGGRATFRRAVENLATIFNPIL